MKYIYYFALILLMVFGKACTSPLPESETSKPEVKAEQFLVVLGTAQDAGYPQAACMKACCQAYWKGEVNRQFPVALGLIDRVSIQAWLFEATPDIKDQLVLLSDHLPPDKTLIPDGIFLTHAHIGHYTGLMDLGHEVMGAKAVPVYAMPRMKAFLTNNGPWSQLVELNNISLNDLQENKPVSLTNELQVIPIRVPHRDEFSETVGFRIEGRNRKALFIPDIDKWSKWKRDIKTEIEAVDVALIDGTFLKNGELPNRDMSQIPHPFVEESILLFKDLSDSEKQKITFIHFNHTNPLIWDAAERERVEKAGFRVAREGDIIEL